MGTTNTMESTTTTPACNAQEGLTAQDQKIDDEIVKIQNEAIALWHEEYPGNICNWKR